MKIGAKTYSDSEFAKYLEDKADFLEVSAIKGRDYSFLKNYSLPVVVHAMHGEYGVNIADTSCKKINDAALQMAKELADKTNAKKIILHPGNLSNKNCSIKQALDLIKDLDDRFILENCYSSNPVGGIPKELKEICAKTKKGICFDFNHALLLSNQNKLDFKKTIKEFIKLCPKHFHLCGYKIGSNIDGHLSFEDADYDYSEFFLLLPKDVEITLETSMDAKKVERDLEYVRNKIKNL